MKEYMLYITNASNHNRLETKDAKGNTVYLIEGKKTLIHG